MDGSNMQDIYFRGFGYKNICDTVDRSNTQFKESNGHETTAKQLQRQQRKWYRQKAIQTTKRTETDQRDTQSFHP